MEFHVNRRGRSTIQQSHQAPRSIDLTSSKPLEAGHIIHHIGVFRWALKNKALANKVNFTLPNTYFVWKSQSYRAAKSAVKHKYIIFRCKGSLLDKKRWPMSSKSLSQCTQGQPWHYLVLFCSPYQIVQLIRPFQQPFYQKGAETKHLKIKPNN